MITQPIITLDLHGLTREEAMVRIEQQLRRTPEGTYRIRCIHGYRGGTAIRSMIRREFGYGLEKRILRIVPGDNEGITELVLREY